MIPPAPGLLSITMGWPSASPRCLPRIRAVRSTAPPGGKATMRRTARLGYSWPCTGATIRQIVKARSTRIVNPSGLVHVDGVGREQFVDRHRPLEKAVLREV